jgi:hypothetical protein
MIVQDCFVFAPLPYLLSCSEEDASSSLFVADPFHIECNAAASVTHFEEVKKCFRITYENLLSIQAKYGELNDCDILEAAFKPKYDIS